MAQHRTIARTRDDDDVVALHAHGSTRVVDQEEDDDDDVGVVAERRRLLDEAADAEDGDGGGMGVSSRAMPADVPSVNRTNDATKGATTASTTDTTNGTASSMANSSMANSSSSHGTLKDPDGDEQDAHGDEQESCPICLDALNDKALLDGCFHSFCFECIMSWLNVSRTCPLCKAPVSSVIHSIKSATIFKRITLPPQRPPAPEPAPPFSRHHPHHHHHHHRRHHHAGAFDARRDRRRHTTSRWSAHETVADERRRETGLDRRRAVYAANMRALPEYDEQLRARERSIAPSGLARDERNRRRVLAWAKRDINALVPTNTAFVYAYLESLLSTTDLRATHILVQSLAPFLLAHTELFVHELQMFARSPLSMPAYDAHVRYQVPTTDQQRRMAQQHGLLLGPPRRPQQQQLQQPQQHQQQHQQQHVPGSSFSQLQLAQRPTISGSAASIEDDGMHEERRQRLRQWQQQQQQQQHVPRAAVTTPTRVMAGAHGQSMSSRPPLLPHPFAAAATPAQPPYSMPHQASMAPSHPMGHVPQVRPPATLQQRTSGNDSGMDGDEWVPHTEEDMRLLRELRAVRAKRAKVREGVLAGGFSSVQVGQLSMPQLCEHVHQLEKDVLQRRKRILALRREQVNQLREAVSTSAGVAGRGRGRADGGGNDSGDDSAD
ncbi:hypothetical protein PTSG_01964 [Salpingoeca rosetta]|uniref:RING-type E3 ubiquitin transferase n=1 Tax=Salpingoeca rosetta (strain ATCC 50818 / BSB-021) TaxID=946362 RepID=F2TZG9_SALR5|nr:uncharacterized protein PTSG_01964 [Salpingoeca rosetta]EGD78993.1 hypothetical protein PTSG_01964 [Salpingoeca rosetta]|eukprot:XP_004997949.1 hypothetical protein PTSG_01964 [Salpingoeca rosetta]